MRGPDFEERAIASWINSYDKFQKYDYTQQVYKTAQEQKSFLKGADFPAFFNVEPEFIRLLQVH